MKKGDGITQQLIKMGNRFFLANHIDEQEAQSLTMEAFLKFHLHYDPAKAGTSANPEKAFFRTQLQFTLLQYWNKQRPAIGEKIKIGKDGYPELDEKGDPKMEPHRAEFKPYGEGSVDQDEDDPPGKLAWRMDETGIADGVDGADGFDTPRPEDPSIKTIHYKGRSIATNSVGEIFQYYMLSGRSMKRYFDLPEKAPGFPAGNRTKPEWRKLSGPALLELERLAAFRKRANKPLSD
jgi:hypothetical protein